jgi:hypothetical protein
MYMLAAYQAMRKGDQGLFGEAFKEQPLLHCQEHSLWLLQMVQAAKKEAQKQA